MVRSNILKYSKSKTIKNKMKSVISEVLSDYISNSTIHGVSYIGAKGKNLTERVWWIIGLILSVVACTYFINKTWTKWVENPVIVSFANEHTSIWEIPFPAVTICPLNKVNQLEFNYTAYFLALYNESGFEGWNVKSSKIFWDVSFICDPLILAYPDDVANITDEDIISTIKMVAPDKTDAISIVIWQNGVNDEDVEFVDQITSEGLCFTSNALGHDDMYTKQIKEGVRFIDSNESTTWSIENGYSTNDEEVSYPKRTSQAGLANGLDMYLFTKKSSRSKYCGENVLGFKMILHNPAEIPRLSESYFLVPINQKVIVAVTPNVIRTEKALVDIPPHTRNCYFNHEKKLRFFKMYTQNNCKTECLANITREYCGCLPFYLPRDKNTKVCGYRKSDCIKSAKEYEFKYRALIKKTRKATTESEKAIFEIIIQCDCLPSCDYIDYEVELSHADYDFNDDEYLRNDEWEISPTSIFFKVPQFLALERSELYGQTDFISSVGGLLGLFVGFSFLSLLEIIYFATLKLWCMVYQKNKAQTEVVWLEK